MTKPLDPEFSDEDDFDEEYFMRTYRPLSNLPTPPPSSRESSTAQSPKSLLEDGGLLDSALLGPAIHLVNLIPTAASLAPASVSRVHDMLFRADLPLETIALAVCILDSLNSRFSLNWRLLCPLAQLDSVDSTSKRHTISVSPAVGHQTNRNQLHIDCVNPEVMILASLIIAVKFLEDNHRDPRDYRLGWGDNIWTSEQINVTERCIMESLGYRILPLCDPRLIADAMDDMDRAGRQALSPLQGSDSGPGPAHARSVSAGAGKAVFGLGMQLTPLETPVSEKGPVASLQQPFVIDRTMRDTFPGPALVRDSLRLPMMKRKKSYYDSD